MQPVQPGRCQAIKGRVCWQHRCGLDGCSRGRHQLPLAAQVTTTARKSCRNGLARRDWAPSSGGAPSAWKCLDAGETPLLSQAVCEQTSLGRVTHEHAQGRCLLKTESQPEHAARETEARLAHPPKAMRRFLLSKAFCFFPMSLPSHPLLAIRSPPFPFTHGPLGPLLAFSLSPLSHLVPSRPAQLCSSDILGLFCLCND